MKAIISVSRRTDIPAFYGDWFMNRLKDGFAGVVHPFGGRKYVVSLKPEDVVCFVFWSKDFAPTRNQCGCTESTDIGAYDTCPHGCVYCYANANKQKAFQAADRHDHKSAFFGYSKPQSDHWGGTGILPVQTRTGRPCYQTLFFIDQSRRLMLFYHYASKIKK